MALAVAAVIAPHRRLDQAHHIVGRARNRIADERQWDGVRRRGTGRRGGRRRPAKMPGNGQPHQLANLVIGHGAAAVSTTGLHVHLVDNPDDGGIHGR